jgi:7-cyano-7-deazaguanine synthase in queuosine biosynthesis
MRPTEQIKATCEAATKGPWATDGRDEVVDSTGDAVCFTNEDNGYEHDATFIAHARQDVPDLISEVERLRGENESLRRTISCQLDPSHQREIAQMWHCQCGSCHDCQARASGDFDALK